MIFGLNSKTAPVHIDQINLQVKQDSTTKKVTVKQTPTKVTPTNDWFINKFEGIVYK